MNTRDIEIQLSRILKAYVEIVRTKNGDLILRVTETLGDGGILVTSRAFCP